MGKIRVFIAIDIPEYIKDQLINVQNALRESTNNVKWVVPGNLHLTLKFLGEIEENRSDQIIDAMNSCAKGISRFSLELEGLGSFPGRGRPRVIWAGIGGQMNKLLSLQQNLELQLEQAGFPKETRKYSPHLTLGRTRETGELGSLPETISQYQSHPFGQWEVPSIQLIKSILRPEGSFYSVMAHSPLGTV